MAGQRHILGPFFHLGNLLTDGTLAFFESGTSTPKAIYVDRALTTAADNPLPSDANGLFTFYAEGLYKVILLDQHESNISVWDETEFPASTIEDD